jgi:hypothetical protein
MAANGQLRTTNGRGRLYESVLDTIGDPPCIRVSNLGPKGVQIYVKAEAFQSRRVGEGPASAIGQIGLPEMSSVLSLSGAKQTLSSLQSAIYEYMRPGSGILARLVGVRWRLAATRAMALNAAINRSILVLPETCLVMIASASGLTILKGGSLS